MKQAAAAMAVLFVLLNAQCWCQQSQNPSPMVEHTRAHQRLEKLEPPGQRYELEGGIRLFVPEAIAKSAGPARVLLHMHGGHWLPEVAAAKQEPPMACLSVQIGSGSGRYARRFGDESALGTLLENAEEHCGRKLGTVVLSAWSAGCGGVREILRHERNDALLERVLLLDGIHTGYKTGKPGPRESELATAKLAPFVRFARRAMKGERKMYVAHTTIFPGTYASTTETADWLLREIGVPRKAVLKWGPMGTQQLSEATIKGFVLHGFAGNSAPDHIDLLHALPQLLSEPQAPATQP